MSQVLYGLLGGLSGFNPFQALRGAFSFLANAIKTIARYMWKAILFIWRIIKEIYNAVKPIIVSIARQIARDMKEYPELIPLYGFMLSDIYYSIDNILSG